MKEYCMSKDPTVLDAYETTINQLKKENELMRETIEAIARFTYLSGSRRAFALERARECLKKLNNKEPGLN